jgi:hypothetical protein
MEQSVSAEIQATAANDLIIIANENSESQMEHQDTVLAKDITKMLESSEPPLSPECCIYMVPIDLCKVNEKPYAPQVILIGTFHRSDERLETMEKLIKVTYFKRFVQKAELNVKNLLNIIRYREVDVRCFYSHTSGLSSNDYVKMIMLDASFFVVFFFFFFDILQA